MEDQEFDIRSILGLLRRRFWLIAVTVVLILGATSVALFALKPAYTASSLVLVDPSHKDLLDPNTQAGGSSTDSARVESEVELVKSDTTLLRVIDEAGLLQDPEFGVQIGLRDTILAWLRIKPLKTPTGDEALQGVLSKLRNSVTAQRRGLTYLISVQARASDADTAAKLANAVARAYIRQQLEAKIDSTRAAHDIIQSRIADANAQVVAAEEAFDGFISDNIETISTQTGRPDIANLRRELEAADTARVQLVAAADLANQSLARQDWTTLAENLQSEAVRQYETQRQQLEQTLTGVADGSQEAINLRAELNQIEQRLGTAANAELSSLRQQISSSQARASDLRTQLRASVLSSNLPASVLTDIYELQQNSEIARNQYQTLLGRLKELDAQAYLQVADSRVVSEAFPPNNPSFPNTRVMLALAAIAALGLGVGLAFVYENFIGGFVSEGQVESVLKTPVAAAVPRQRPLKSSATGDPLQSLSDIVMESPLSMFSESVRRLRVGIDQALRRWRAEGDGEARPRGSVVMLTSASSGEGKSTLALALARTYALSGRPTLLIDCDLRKPSIHRQLGIEPSVGLLDYLNSADESLSLSSIVETDESSGAQIVVGARRSDSATDQLVTGKAFARLIDAAAKSFEIVILDTPPVGPVVDGLYLAEFADVIVFAVRWATTSQQDARGAVAALRDAKRGEVEVLAVLNQQADSKAKYRAKYAGYYSEA